MNTPVPGAVSAWALEIVRPGVATTIQDLGRAGAGRFGVSPSGAMDAIAHRLANRLVGNAESAAALEITGVGVEIAFAAPVAFAIAGADLGATLDDTTLPAAYVGVAGLGARLRFGQRRRGARVSLAVAGGIAVPPAARFLRSAATDLAAGLGGLDGRPLRAGACLAVAADDGPTPVRPPKVAALGSETLAEILQPLTALYEVHPGRLRFVSEEDPDVADTVRRSFPRARYRLSPRSNRTGYRFEGPPLPVSARAERLSEPTAPGAIQLPPDGLPILLLADRNTTGGYPRLGHVISADLPRAAQLWPGDPVHFEAVSLDEAVARAGHLERLFAKITTALMRGAALRR